MMAALLDVLLTVLATMPVLALARQRPQQRARVVTIFGLKGRLRREDGAAAAPLT
jgi:hypothetical protein